jgi:hypothetical protein
MMALNNIGSTADISQLASRLMDRVDANKDGQLSKEEFGSFLTSLLRGLPTSSPTSPAKSSIATTSLLKTATAAAGTTHYQPIPGFDMGKMNNLEHTTPKYLFARAVQDLGLFSAPLTSNLQAVVDALNANGMNATVTGDDTIDFGDGAGPIDVIFSVGDPEARWQWVPTT